MHSVSKCFSAVVISVFFIICIPTVSWSQKTKTELDREKKEKLKKIKEIENILNETTSKKNNTLGELNALDQQISQHVGLINTIKGEISYLDGEIDETTLIIGSLEEDLVKLKSEYASMLYATQKANNGLTKITFLFSSSSFTELRARYKYMEQYAEARKKQVSKIELVTSTLVDKIDNIEEQKSEKEKLLVDQVKQNQRLLDLKNKRNIVYLGLQSEENNLRKDIEDTKMAIAEINRKIKEAIEIELAKASKSNAPVISSSSFANNKAKLPWPVHSGFVSQKFGRHNHPALKSVVVENEGIYIQTQQNEKAVAIFAGDVRVIFPVPSMGICALIQHGEYYTVYGGLKTPLVKAGEKVEIGQVIGEVVTKPEGTTLLWFEIRKGRDPLNPELWLVKK
ncbi:MAG: peptidoglycan DD-metalloendopeptidase family protein [Cyclobacteriaceae bacterium]|nr:peptidoglycan DD-metalloendopeptidase family protein [Cyclobacteriaceae bacterium]